MERVKPREAGGKGVLDELHAHRVGQAVEVVLIGNKQVLGFGLFGGYGVQIVVDAAAAGAPPRATPAPQTPARRRNPELGQTLSWPQCNRPSDFWERSFCWRLNLLFARPLVLSAARVRPGVPAVPGHTLFKAPQTDFLGLGTKDTTWCPESFCRLRASAAMAFKS